MKFEPPGAGHWELDRSHYEGGTTPIVAELVPTAVSDAYRKLFKHLGVPAETLEMRFVNGFLYHRIRPLVGADSKSTKTPPDWVIGLVARLHPEFRKRNTTAIATLANPPWEQETTRWNTVGKPRLISQNMAIQQVDLESLNDAELAAHLRRTVDHFKSTNEEHHRLHGYDLGPIGELLVAGKGWGLNSGDMLETLVGASPSTQEPLRRLAQIRFAVDEADGSLDSLESIRQSSPEAAELLDRYLERFGYVLYAGYDIDSPVLVENPDVLLSSIQSARNPTDVGARAQAAADQVRSRIPAAEQYEFDLRLANARAAMDMRDDNGPITIEWPSGLLRVAMLEAGRRLAASGRIADPNHMFELEVAELFELATSRTGPSLEDLADRAVRRAAQSKLVPPESLGPLESPPPLDALPEPTAKLLGLVGTLTNELLAIPEDTSNKEGVFVGTGIGQTKFTGIARTADSAEEAMAEMEPGEILVTRTTSPAYNLVLSMAGGLVTETGGAASHAAVLSRELDLPAVIGAPGCLAGINSGDRIEIDAATGTVTITLP